MSRSAPRVPWYRYWQRAHAEGDAGALPSGDPTPRGEAAASETGARPPSAEAPSVGVPFHVEQEEATSAPLDHPGPSGHQALEDEPVLEGGGHAADLTPWDVPGTRSDRAPLGDPVAQRQPAEETAPGDGEAAQPPESGGDLAGGGAGTVPAGVDAASDPPLAEPAFHVEQHGGAPERPTPAPDASEPRDPGATQDPSPRVQGNGGRPGHLLSSPPTGSSSVRFARARVLTIANQKGGVGKTTTAVSLSAALADLGSRVLLVDLDPQGNATSGVGVRVPEGRPTVYDVLLSGTDVEDAIEPTSVRNLFVLPSTLDLAGAEIELVSAFSREQKLRLALETVRDEYDLVLIDCPPSLGLLTVNALSAGDGLLVPIQCEYYALEGLSALRRNVDLIRSQLNPNLDITGFVLTMLDARTRLSQQVVDEVRAHFGELVFTTRIPRSVRLAEAPGFGQPITVFDPASRGAMAYRRMALELLERLTPTDDGPPPDGRQAEGAPV